MPRKVILTVALFCGLAGYFVYWFFFDKYEMNQEHLFEYSYVGYEDEAYRQRYRPYIQEVYLRFIKQESNYAEAQGFSVKFTLGRGMMVGEFGVDDEHGGVFYVDATYTLTRYDVYFGRFHDYLADLKRQSDFFESELRLLSSLGAYPFIVPIDPQEDSSLFPILPRRAKNAGR